MKSTSTLKLFIVDDDPFCLAIYQQYLKNIGYTDTCVFYDGISCLGQLPMRPDVIFLDGSVNEVGNVNILKEIKLLDPTVYVVFLTGNAKTEDISLILDTGAFEYIVKGDNDLFWIKDVLYRIKEIKARSTQLTPSFATKVSPYAKNE